MAQCRTLHTGTRPAVRGGGVAPAPGPRCLITGWARHKDRYAKYFNTLPLVVFVCRDEESAREFCRAADPVVTACHSLE